MVDAIERTDPQSGPSPVLDAVLAPWPGFAWAAQAAVDHLHAQLGMDLWLVTHVVGDEQVVVAATGPWADMAPAGAAFPWPESFCIQMVQRQAPMVALDVRDVPDYAVVATGILARVQAYIGVPLLTEEGELFGTLCAIAGTPQSSSLVEHAEAVPLLARMLSTILAGETLALNRSEDAAEAYALAERDRLTGLRNRRGWEAALAQEDARCQRYGSSASIVMIDLDDLKDVNDRAGHASGDALLTKAADALDADGRPGDVLARWGGDEFGVLAVEADALAARSLRRRLLVALRSVGVSACAGVATRRPGEFLEDTVLRADQAMYEHKRTRAKRPRTS